MTRPARLDHYAANPARFSDDDALEGGRWVNVRGIQRWQPDEPPRKPLACPLCLATIDEPCVSPRSYDHAERVTPLRPKPAPKPPGVVEPDKRCECGAEVTGRGRARYCDPCRIRSRRASWRRNAAKQYAQIRAARQEAS